MQEYNTPLPSLKSVERFLSSRHNLMFMPDVDPRKAKLLRHLKSIEEPVTWVADFVVKEAEDRADDAGGYEKRIESSKVVDAAHEARNMVKSAFSNISNDDTANAVQARLDKINAALKKMQADVVDVTVAWKYILKPSLDFVQGQVDMIRDELLPETRFSKDLVTLFSPGTSPAAAKAVLKRMSNARFKWRLTYPTSQLGTLVKDLAKEYDISSVYALFDKVSEEYEEFKTTGTPPAELLMDLGVWEPVQRTIKYGKAARNALAFAYLVGEKPKGIHGKTRKAVRTEFGDLLWDWEPGDVDKLDSQFVAYINKHPAVRAVRVQERAGLELGREAGYKRAWPIVMINSSTGEKVVIDTSGDVQNRYSKFSTKAAWDLGAWMYVTNTVPADADPDALQMFIRSRVVYELTRGGYDVSYIKEWRADLDRHPMITAMGTHLDGWKAYSPKNKGRKMADGAIVEGPYGQPGIAYLDGTIESEDDEVSQRYDDIKAYIKAELLDGHLYFSFRDWGDTPGLRTSILGGGGETEDKQDRLRIMQRKLAYKFPDLKLTLKDEDLIILVPETNVEP